MAGKVRDWIYNGDELDRDCIYRYEYLLGRKLKDWNEYHEIDEQVDEMVLEFTSRKEFFEAYPNLRKYKN